MNSTTRAIIQSMSVVLWVGFSASAQIQGSTEAEQNPSLTLRQILESGEKHTAAWFASAEVAIRRWGRDTNASVRAAMSDVAEALLKESAPTNSQDALAYFTAKEGAVNALLDNTDIYWTREGWIKLAGCIGEARARIIPGFRPQSSQMAGMAILTRAGVRSADELTNEVDKVAYSLAMDEISQQNAEAMLQSKITRFSGSLLWSLRGQCARMNTRDESFTNFVNHVATRAQLTENEKKKLLGMPAP